MTNDSDDDLPDQLPKLTESITIRMTPEHLAMFAYVAHLQGSSVADCIRESAWFQCDWFMREFAAAQEDTETPAKQEVVH